MSMTRCDECDRYVDSDDDSVVCEHCRDTAWQETARDEMLDDPRRGQAEWINKGGR